MIKAVRRRPGSTPPEIQKLVVDDDCPDCRARLEQLWYFVAEDGLDEIPADWQKRCRRCAAACEQVAGHDSEQLRAAIEAVEQARHLVKLMRDEEPDTVPTDHHLAAADQHLDQCRVVMLRAWDLTYEQRKTAS
jgi:hypothetical protein